MGFFHKLSRLLRWPTVLLSREGKLYYWAAAARGEEPQALCETLQASVEYWFFRFVQKVNGSRPLQWLVVSVAVVVTAIAYSFVVYISFTEPNGWTIYPMLVPAAVITIIGLFIVAILYRGARWVAKHLCPIKVRCR